MRRLRPPGGDPPAPTDPTGDPDTGLDDPDGVEPTPTAHCVGARWEFTDRTSGEVHDIAFDARGHTRAPLMLHTASSRIGSAANELMPHLSRIVTASPGLV